MVESFITANMISRGETAIDDYLETSQSNYANIRNESFADLLLDLDAMNLNTRQLCERLSLQTSVTQTTSLDGTKSKEDFAHRMRLVIPVSAITGNAVFTLQGTDDQGTTYTAIELVSDNGDSGTTKTISAIAIGDTANSYLIMKLYTKYRLQLISIGTTITYTAYMIEEIYTSLHRDKTRANIYRSLIKTDGDIWIEKQALYEDAYKNKLSYGRLRVDFTDDEEISQREGEKVISNIRFRS